MGEGCIERSFHPPHLTDLGTMKAYVVCLLVASAVLSACAPDSASDRSEPSVVHEVAMFRGGPTHAGVYETEGVEQEPSIVWSFATGGRVLSSPAVTGDRAYFGAWAYDVASDPSSHRLHALSRERRQSIRLLANRRFG